MEPTPENLHNLGVRVAEIHKFLEFVDENKAKVGKQLDNVNASFEKLFQKYPQIIREPVEGSPDAFRVKFPPADSFTAEERDEIGRKFYTVQKLKETLSKDLHQFDHAVEPMKHKLTDAYEAYMYMKSMLESTAPPVRDPEDDPALNPSAYKVVHNFSGYDFIDKPAEGKGKRKKRRMRGGARSTAEAVTGLVLHPVDSMNDFKKLFTDFAGIYNNGDIGAGLRSKGKSVVSLVIKYLPIAGVPGVAAATSLEKLKVDKWIEVFATLIDFLTGRKNLLAFLNSLKELVSDIFNMLKELLGEFFKPENLTSVARGVEGALTTMGEDIIGVFDPNVASQVASNRAEQANLAQDKAAADAIINAVVEDAQLSFDEHYPVDFDDAISKATGAPPYINRYLDTWQEIQEQEKKGYEVPSMEEKQRKEDIAQMRRDFTGKSRDAYNQQMRVDASRMANVYKVPYFLWMKEHWDERPGFMKEYPPFTWTPEEFYQKAVEYVPGHRTEFDNLNESIMKDWLPAYAQYNTNRSKIDQANKDIRNKAAAESEKNIRGSREAFRISRVKKFYKDFLQQHKITSLNDDELVNEFGAPTDILLSVMPPMTMDDRNLLGAMDTVPSRNDGTVGPEVGTEEFDDMLAEIDDKIPGLLEKAVASHSKPAAYLEVLHMDEQMIDWANREPNNEQITRSVPQSRVNIEKIFRYVSKLPGGVEVLQKEMDNPKYPNTLFPELNEYLPVKVGSAADAEKVKAYFNIVGQPAAMIGPSAADLDFGVPKQEEITDAQKQSLQAFQTQSLQPFAMPTLLPQAQMATPPVVAPAAVPGKKSALEAFRAYVKSLKVEKSEPAPVPTVAPVKGSGKRRRHHRTDPMFFCDRPMKSGRAFMMREDYGESD